MQQNLSLTVVIHRVKTLDEAYSKEHQKIQEAITRVQEPEQTLKTKEEEEGSTVAEKYKTDSTS